MDLQYYMAYSELHFYLKHWGENVHQTKAQRKKYSCKRFKLAQLGNAPVSEKEDSIRLLAEDHWDGEYVGSVSPTTASQYGWRKDYHVHPRCRDLLRFGIFFHLGFYKTVILIIKSLCEQHLYQAMVEEGIASDTPLIDLIEGLSVSDHRLVDFANDLSKSVNIDELYNLFEAHNSLASKSGYDYKKFKMLVEDIATDKIQAYRLNSEHVRGFINDRETERTGINTKEKSIQEQYYKLKQEWIEHKNSVELLLIQQENIRERSSSIRSEWSKIFGEMEIRINSLKCRKEELAFIIDIKESNSEKSYDEVLKLAEKNIEERRKKYEEERKQIELLMLTAKIIDQNEALDRFFAGKVTIEKQIEYSNKLKKMQRKTLAKVYFLTHPDRTVHEKFTDKQREELLELYNSIGTLKKLNRLSAADMMPMVDSVLKKAERIWDSMGVNIDEYDLTIINEEPEKMIQILHTKIACLEEEDTNLRNEIFLLLSDSDITEMEAVLSNEASVKLKEEEYQLEIAALMQSVKESEKTVNLLFGKE